MPRWLNFSSYMKYTKSGSSTMIKDSIFNAEVAILQATSTLRTLSSPPTLPSQCLLQPPPQQSQSQRRTDHYNGRRYAIPRSSFKLTILLLPSAYLCSTVTSSRSLTHTRSKISKSCLFPSPQPNSNPYLYLCLCNLVLTTCTSCLY